MCTEFWTETYFNGEYLEYFEDNACASYEDANCDGDRDWDNDPSYSVQSFESDGYTVMVYIDCGPWEEDAGGAIAGGVIGALILIICCSVCCFFGIKKMRGDGDN